MLRVSFQRVYCNVNTRWHIMLDEQTLRDVIVLKSDGSYVTAQKIKMRVCGWKKNEGSGQTKGIELLSRKKGTFECVLCIVEIKERNKVQRSVFAKGTKKSP